MQGDAVAAQFIASPVHELRNERGLVATGFAVNAPLGLHFQRGELGHLANGRHDGLKFRAGAGEGFFYKNWEAFLFHKAMTTFGLLKEVSGV